MVILQLRKHASGIERFGSPAGRSARAADVARLYATYAHDYANYTWRRQASKALYRNTK
jgi:hypothetical protein